jgi:hypothetical protein
MTCGPISTVPPRARTASVSAATSSDRSCSTALVQDALTEYLDRHDRRSSR